MSNRAAFEAHILSLSVADSYGVAHREWKLDHIELSEELDECPCGHEIKELCFIRNLKNGETTYVGNVCVKNFMDIDTGTLFDGLKRIQKDLTANPNAALIEYANEKGYLYEGEYDFLMKTCKKRVLSVKQIAWKEKINRRIINGIVVKRRKN